MQPTKDLNVLKTVRLIAPTELWSEIPMSDLANQTVVAGRDTIKKILAGQDPRMMVMVGPCSIHNTEQAMDYARRLRDLSEKVKDKIFIVMRVYFEKPRTTVGWKGLINDPHLDDSFDIATGLRRARKLLLDIAELGLATCTEMLEPITPQYIADLVSCAAIGARTTESPTHRQLSSGLSMPVGFKNGTDGSLQIAIDAMISARAKHAFLGIDDNGQTCVVYTNGNPWAYLILRGGRSGPNWQSEAVQAAVEQLSKYGQTPRLVVDCSHANSDKDHKKQSNAWNDLVRQRAEGNHSIIGLMLESNIHEGAQKLTDPAKLKYGVSITDACVNWEETEALMLSAHKTLAEAKTHASV